MTYEKANILPAGIGKGVGDAVGGIAGGVGTGVGAVGQGVGGAGKTGRRKRVISRAEAEANRCPYSQWDRKWRRRRCERRHCTYGWEEAGRG